MYRMLFVLCRQIGSAISSFPDAAMLVAYIVGRLDL
jgi:hypothetical protein